MSESIYRERLDDLAQRVQDLPPEQREQLKELLAESMQRHDEIATASQQSKKSLERLDVTLQLNALANASMLEAVERLRGS